MDYTNVTEKLAKANYEIDMAEAVHFKHELLDGMTLDWESAATPFKMIYREKALETIFFISPDIEEALLMELHEKALRQDGAGADFMTDVLEEKGIDPWKF